MKSSISNISPGGRDSIPVVDSGTLSCLTVSKAFLSGGLNRKRFLSSAVRASCILHPLKPLFHTEKAFHRLYNLKNLKKLEREFSEETKRIKGNKS